MTNRQINTEAKHLLLDLIEVLQDGHKGMMDMGQHLKSASGRDLLLRESQVRAEFAAEIENSLHRMGEPDVEQRGTVGGALHRAWGELRAMLGSSDESLLGGAELGEMGTKKVYERALNGDLPGDVRELVSAQQQHILGSLEQIAALRRAHAA